MSTVNQAIGVSFNTTGIYVGFKLYDWTSGSPVLIPGPDNNVFPMVNTYAGAYGAVFSRDPTKTYQAIYNVYTDGTYATLDSSGNYATGEIDYPVMNPATQVVLGGVASSGEIVVSIVQPQVNLSIVDPDEIVLIVNPDIII